MLTLLLRINLDTPAVGVTLNLTAAQANRLKAILRLHGLIDPLVVTPTSRGDAAVAQTLSGSTDITVTTTTLPAYGTLTEAMLDDLARWYGLIDPMVESATSRTDGTLTQTMVVVGDTATLTRV